MELVANFTLFNETLDTSFNLSEGVTFDALFAINAAGATWGNIDGTLSNQTDLQIALDLKADKLTVEADFEALNDTITENYDTLDSKIDNVQSALSGDISALSETVTNNNTAIHNRVDGIVDSFDSDIEGINTDISNLETTVTDNYTTLNTNIQNEAAQRAENDSLLQNGINTITDNLNSEISARESADTNLQTQITNLSGTVSSNYNTLDNKIKSVNTSLQGELDTLKTTVNTNTDSISELNTTVSHLSDTVQSNYTILDTKIDAAKADLQGNIDTLSGTVTSNYNNLNGAITSNVSTINTRIDSEVSTLEAAISSEETSRTNADNALQAQIDSITASSDVVDIVGTYAELQTYNTTNLRNNDIIKVLSDENRNNETTYYRWVITDGVGAWVFVGSEGAHYTKSEADARFVSKEVTVNGQSLDSDIVLNASDVGALPNTTTIGNATITFTQGGVVKGSITANQTTNQTIDFDEGGGSSITVDSGLSTTSENPVQNKVITTALNNKENTIEDLETIRNGAALGSTALQNITSSDIISALGYTPYNSTNPNGYTSNYPDLTNKPGINGVELVGNKTGADLGLQSELTFDSTPTSGSSNPVTSGGVYNALGDYATTTALTNGLAGKQNTLTAGDNIQINGNTISATDTKYSAGNNVQITNNVISATDTTYTAGDGITITNGVISASGGSAAVDTSVIDKALNEKQNALTAGEGVKFGYKLTDTQQVAPTCMAYGNGVFLGVSHGTKSKGYPSSVYRWNFDPDDFTWSTKEEISTLSGYRWEDMCFDGKRFVLLSYDGYISTSEDGHEWTEPESVLEDDSYSQILYSNGHYLAIDEDTNRLAYTDNTGFEAGEWEYAEVFSEDDVYYFEPNRNGFVALRNDGYVTFSSTGAVWTTPEQVITLGAEQDIEGLVYTGDRYIATVHVSTDTYRWLSSRDCKTWADIDIDIPDEDSVFPLARVINASSQLFFDLSGELYTAEETITAESGVFVATYGTTTYAEVLAAYEAGKAVFVFNKSDRLLAPLCYVDGSPSTFMFTTSENLNLYYYTLNSGGSWTRDVKSVESSSYKVTSLSSSRTNTQYPSAKCVYDALKTKQDVLTAGDGITISANTISAKQLFPGQIIDSRTPISDSGLHLADGSVLSGSGIYADFVNTMAGLSSTDSFCTLAEWQACVNNYGFCSKYVYDSSANTVRLPKLMEEGRYLIKTTSTDTGFCRIYSDGWCVQSNIMTPSGSSATTSTITLPIPYLSANYFVVCNYSASSSNQYGQCYKVTASTFVIKGYGGNANRWLTAGYIDISDYEEAPIYQYIVVGTTAKSSAEIDMDNITAELNQKVDKNEIYYDSSSHTLYVGVSND